MYDKNDKYSFYFAELWSDVLRTCGWSDRKSHGGEKGRSKDHTHPTTISFSHHTGLPKASLSIADGNE